MHVNSSLLCAFGAKSSSFQHARHVLICKTTGRREHSQSLSRAEGRAADLVSYTSPVTVKNLPGRGYGVIATSAIEAGTLILAEEPLVKVSDRKRDVEACVSALAQPQQDRYYALHDNFSGMYAPVEGIFKTNAIQLGDTGYGGVFALASRLNSSCRPNVAVTWSEKQGRIVLHAIESIQEADELCICYISPLATRQERRLELLERYKFLCKCPACTATEPEGLSSDERRRRIGELDDYLQSQLRVDPLRSLQLVSKTNYTLCLL